ncbi:MAG: MFS transporter [Burkholderiales bacterium]|nr:MFS transporter [Burkholderiales bacterium]
MTLYLVVALALLNHTSFKGSKVLISLYALDLGASQLLIGVLYAMYSVFPIVLAVYAGKLADRVGMRGPMLLGSAGLAAGLLIPFAFSGVAALFISATLIGMLYIFFIVAMQSLIGFLPGERAKNYSVFSLGIAASNLVGPLAVGFAIDHHGHALTYLFIAAVPAVAIAWLAAGARFLPGPRDRGSDHHGRATLAMLRRNRSLRELLIAGGAIETGLELYTFYMPIHGNAIGLSASRIGMVMAAYAAALMAIRFLMPALVRRLGEIELLRLSMLLSAAVYCAFPFAGHIAWLLVLSFVLGLGLGCCSPLSLMIIHARAPAGRAGEALGVRQTVNKITEAGAPVAFGALGAVLGMMPLFWATSALLFGASVLVRTRTRREA